jgi:galactose mutarotase-like enzyme
MRFSVQAARHIEHEAVRLADTASELEAVFLPTLGMLGASLRHRGEELLGLTDEVPRYASKGSTLGIPLLHPWANRLGGATYRAAGRSVELDLGSPLLQLEEHGLAIHGVVGPWLPWRVREQRATPGGAMLAARLEYTTDDLLTAFPFPHALVQEVSLDAGGLTVTTSLTPAGDGAVPITFGYHPYLHLPGLDRESWRVELPAMRRLLLDERQVPSGEEEAFAGLTGALDRDYDDGFAGLADGVRFALEAAGRRIEVTFLEGYPYGQVFAPPGKDFVCIEPMTAPANALQSGDGLRLVDPGATFQAAFRISVTSS